MLDDALGDLAGRQKCVVDAQVVLAPVELPARIELVPCVVIEQVAPGRIEVTPRWLLGQARQARSALEPLSLGRFQFDEQHACAALAERLGVLLDLCLVRGQVERPDIGEDQARQVAGRDLLDDQPADRASMRWNAGVPKSKYRSASSMAMWL